MRKPASSSSRRQISSINSVPAPINGLNKRDPLAQMKPLDAVILDNYFCKPTEIMMRRGYSSYSTGITGDVQTIMDYDNGTSETVFACADNAGSCSIYDITSGGAVGAAVVSGLTSAKFKHAHFSNSAGLFAHYVNGADSLRIYDGSTWYTVTGASSPYAITGVTTSDLKDVIVHMRRLWFVEKNSMNGWYLAADAISGAATKFDFGPIFMKGGEITKIATWTIDAGIGMDDHFVVFTSNGEVGIYKGTDPSSSTTWALVGVFALGEPVGINPETKYAGDILVITRDGLLPLSRALIDSRVTNLSGVSDKIQPQLASDAVSYSSYYGWQLILYPEQNMLIMNVPISSTTSIQYVMNTITKAWSSFSGINARCWYYANNTLFFGDSSGGVYKFWDTNADAGSDINGEVLPAFNSFGNDSQLKFCTTAKVNYGFTADVGISAAINTDFDTSAPLTSPTFTSKTGAIWDTSVWDTATWAGDLTTDTQWYGVAGVGYYHSFHVKTATNNSDFSLYGIDYVYGRGGML